MRAIGVATSLGLAVALWVAPGYAQIRLETPSNLAQLGAGYDAFTGDIRGDCVSAAETTQTEGISTYFEVVRIENERDFSKRLGVSAKAKYGLFTAGGSRVNETTFNSYSVYLAVVARVNVRTNTIKTPTLNPAALQLAGGDPIKFRQRCGNYFVRANTLGGEYSALVEIFTSTLAEKQDTSVAAGGAAGVFKASGEASAKINSVVKDRKYTVKLVRKGGQGPIAGSADGILGEALGYPVELAKLQDRDLFTASVEVQDYLTLTIPDVLRNGPSETEALLRVERYDELAQERRAHLGDIEYILANPEQFPQTDRLVLERHAAGLRDVLFRMKSALAQCFDPALRKCNSTDLKDPTSDFKLALPERLPGPTRQEMANRIVRSQAALGQLLTDRFAVDTCSKASAGVPFPGSGPAFLACANALRTLREECAARGCSP